MYLVKIRKLNNIFCLTSRVPISAFGLFKNFTYTHIDECTYQVTSMKIYYCHIWVELTNAIRHFAIQLTCVFSSNVQKKKSVLNLKFHFIKSKFSVISKLSYWILIFLILVVCSIYWQNPIQLLIKLKMDGWSMGHLNNSQIFQFNFKLLICLFLVNWTVI